MTLPNLGTSLGSIPVSLERVRTLEYFEGDRIVEMKSENGDPFLKIWFDTDGEVTRWLTQRVPSVVLSRFLARRVSLRDIMLDPVDGFFYAIDYNNADNGLCRVAMVRADDISPDEIPLEDSFHDPTLHPPSDRDNSQLLLLDGTWDVPRLSYLDRKYKSVYATFAVLGTEPRRRSLPLDSLVDYDFRGAGWPHGKALEKIRSLIKPEDTPSVQVIQYASPGLVRYSVSPELARRVQGVLGQYEKNQEELDKRYDALHSLLVELYRVRKEPQSEDRKRMIGSITRSLPTLINRLLELLPLDSKALWAIGGRPESVGQVLASIYRQLQQLYNLLSHDATLV